MTEKRATALILGATSQLGMAVIDLLTKRNMPRWRIFAADTATRLPLLRAMCGTLQLQSDDLELIEYDAENLSLNVPAGGLERITDDLHTLFHLDHLRDRTRPTNEVRSHNIRIAERAIELAKLSNNLKALVVVTDVGLTGDYPGRFSETWTDVGQTPFDEVDRTSIEVEQKCLQAPDLPIVRARVGLLSDYAAPGLGTKPWRTAARVLLPSLNFWRHLPRFLAIPTAIAKGALAPLTPTTWAAEALVHLAETTERPRYAVHLVVTPQPALEQVLEMVTRRAGGARLKGELPLSFLKRIAELPGLGDAARRQADQLSSFLALHRYCLSKNDLDVVEARAALRDALPIPVWTEVEDRFFLEFA